MRKIFNYFILFVLILVFYSLYIELSRNFYSVDNKKIITIWKKANDECYIIPGKYYGFVLPEDGFIKISNDSDITFYWSDELLGEIIFKTESKYVLNNNDKLRMISYYDTSKYASLKVVLYGEGPKKIDEVKDNVSIMMINIKENYAIDKKGQKF
jgi:hypothetical protein